jgi:glycosyltransferase involved in cell wall biosynthesis
MILPLVSIITVAYNSEKTIKDTIESVLNQTYPHVEYIIIDGQSSDTTVDIAKSYYDQFKNKEYMFTVISEKDEGIYDAMNKGICLAQGDLIGIINSDDWYERNAIEKVVNAFLSIRFDYFYADLRLMKNQKSSIKKAKMKNYVSSRDWNHPTSFVTKDFYNKFKYRKTGLYSDFDLWLKARNNGCKVYVLNEVLANFRFGGISNEKSIRKAMMRVKERYKIYTSNGYSRWYIFECIAIEAIKLVIA